MHRVKNTPYRHAEFDRRKQTKIDNSESFGGQLLDVRFTSNTDPNPVLKDKVVESVQFEN